MKVGTSRVPSILITMLILAALFFGRETAASDRSAPGGVLKRCGSMNRPRAVHTATLLPNGRVLVAGGMQKNGVFEGTVELYDPAADAFRPGGRMMHRRVGHTATLLSHGKVLIAGGLAGRHQESGRWVGDVLAKAELYDPKTETFSSTGTMTALRANHVAVRLTDGKVLLVGGSDGHKPLSSAETYDPASGTFRPTGSLSTARVPHGAALLPDGRVLVGGGSGPDRAVLSSVEIYDPALGSFSAAGDLTTGRHKHAVIALPDGRVLVAGGSDERDWQGQKTSAEICDPAAKKCASIPPMRHARFKHGAAAVLLPEGRVLFAGGAAESEIYDPRQVKFLPVSGGFGEARYFSTATVLPDGRVLVAGGYGRGTAAEGPMSTASAWIYDP